MYKVVKPMVEKRLNLVPLSLIAEALDMATDGWKQYLDLEDMKLAAIPDNPDDIPEYVADEDLEKAIREDKSGRFILLPSEEEVDELNDEYDFLDKNGVRLFALEWCQQRGLSSLDDLEIIGKI